MTFKTLLRSLGASALVGAMALTALPATASAQDNGWGREDRARGGGGDRSQARAQAREARQQAQQRAQAAPQQRQYTAPAQAQQAPQAQQRAGRDWNRSDNRSATATQRSGSEWNRRDNSNNNWGSLRASQAQRQAEAQAQAQARAQAQAQAQAQSRTRDTQWGGLRDGDRSTRSGDWQRNGSYADRNRNGSYRDGYRDGRTVDQRQDRNDQRSAYRNGYRDGNVTQHYRDGNRYDRRRYDTNHQRWSNNWRYDNRYNWQSYRNYNRNVYRLGAYYSPYRNYRYSRLSVGFHLDSLFFGSRYWINDPWQYRLPTAYGPYRWIRYYDDALLVDTYTGEVVDVVYSFFW